PSPGLGERRAQHALSAVAAGPSHAQRGLVVGCDVQLDALEPELAEGVVRDQRERAARDASAAGFRRDDVADLALLRVRLDRDQAGHTDERARLRVGDRVAVPRPVAASLRIGLEPLVFVPFAPRLGDTRVRADERILTERSQSRQVLLAERLEPDDAVREDRPILANEGADAARGVAAS